MAMKILIIDDNRAFTQACSEALMAQFPGARIDVAVSVGRYFNDFWNIEYDVCIISNDLYGGSKAFTRVAPALKNTFHDTEILCNTENAGEAENAEKIAKMKLFARSPDGQIVAFGRDVCAMMGYIRTMVVPKGERMSIAPVRVSVAPPRENARTSPGQASGTGSVRRISEVPRNLGVEHPEAAQPLMFRRGKP